MLTAGTAYIWKPSALSSLNTGISEGTRELSPRRGCCLTYSFLLVAPSAWIIGLTAPPESSSVLPWLSAQVFFFLTWAQRWLNRSYMSSEDTWPVPFSHHFEAHVWFSWVSHMSGERNVFFSLPKRELGWNFSPPTVSHSATGLNNSFSFPVATDKEQAQPLMC